MTNCHPELRSIFSSDFELVVYTLFVLVFMHNAIKTRTSLEPSESVFWPLSAKFGASESLFWPLSAKSRSLEHQKWSLEHQKWGKS